MEGNAIGWRGHSFLSGAWHRHSCLCGNESASVRLAAPARRARLLGAWVFAAVALSLMACGSRPPLPAPPPPTRVEIVAAHADAAFFAGYELADVPALRAYAAAITGAPNREALRAAWLASKWLSSDERFLDREIFDRLASGVDRDWPGAWSTRFTPRVAEAVYVAGVRRGLTIAIARLLSPEN